MHSSQRIKAFQDFMDINKYLEVGVQGGHTFNAVNIQYKVAVDPEFLFDYKSFESDKSKFFKVTSDEYFSNLAGNEIFDLIFLDGLHEFPQTLRDFINALNHSHDKTIFILDDVYPNDVYSSLVKDAYRFRQMQNPDNKDGSWHGDVYKALFFINDFFPGISWHTIDYGYGNPQAFLYKKNRINFKPRFNNLEEISRMTYFDLHDNLDILNLVSEDQAISFVRDFIKGS